MSDNNNVDLPSTPYNSSKLEGVLESVCALHEFRSDPAIDDHCAYRKTQVIMHNTITFFMDTNPELFTRAELEARKC